MKRTNLRSTVAGITQNKRVRAIALEVINGRASVKIIGSSKPLYNLPVTGGAIVAGQEVYVDYTTGTPVVHSYQESVESGTVTRVSKVRSIISDPDIPSSSNTFIEAPVDDKIYGRKNAAWIEVTSGSGTSGSGITDHTLLSNIGVNTHDQIDTALTRLANTSGSNTGDQTLAGLGGISDAPADSKEYLRKDNAWVEHTSGSETSGSSVTDHTQLTNIGTLTHDEIEIVLAALSSGSGSGGIEEAPNDGKIYGRQNEAWSEITSGSQTSGSGVSNFLALTDAPDSYSGQASKVVSVKSDETGLEFTTVSGGSIPPSLKKYMYDNFK